MTSRFIQSKTAAKGPLPIERASKTDIMTILTIPTAIFQYPTTKQPEIHFSTLFEGIKEGMKIKVHLGTLRYLL